MFLKPTTSMRCNGFVAACSVFCISLMALVASSHGQNLSLKNPFEKTLGGKQSAASTEKKVEFSGEFKIKPETGLGIVQLSAKIAAKQHLYSVTQKKGGPMRSRISITESDQFEVIGPFTPDAPPHVDENSEAFDVPVEHHEDSVVWSAPIQISEGVDPKNLTLDLIFNGQVCTADDAGQIVGCDNLKNVKVTAKFAGNDDSLDVAPPPVVAAEKVEPYVAKKSHATLSGQIVQADESSGKVVPGDKVILQLTAKPQPGYHVYAYEPQKTGGATSTLIAFTDHNDWSISKPAPSQQPDENKELGYFGHHDEVTWSFEITIPEDAENQVYALNGLIGFQTCTDSTCDPPDAAKFSVGLPVGFGNVPISVEFEAGPNYGDVNKALKAVAEGPAKPADSNESESDVKRVPDTAAEIAEMAALYDPDSKINYVMLKEFYGPPTLVSTFFLIFLGGMILNLMPCVFPVLGLKVMGFVEQAGSDAAKIRMHGIAFTMGLVVSMWALAGIILTLKYTFGRNVSWGAEQMGNPYFVGSIILLLFLLGLNMAGVFELGTSLTRVGGGVQGKKGYTSSFLSGILTTLIATPCSGPFLAGAMGYTLAQPPAIAMLLFTVFALGIAFPYIALSFFPALINKLPRPGAWMHTFKVTMAFALFATVAFFMKTFGAQTGVGGLSWLAMALVVIGLAAFFYGTWSPAYVKTSKRFWFGWVMPALIASLGLWMSYDAANQRNTAVADHTAGGLDWQEWNPGKVEYMLEKKPSIVWVDYTADW